MWSVTDSDRVAGCCNEPQSPSLHACSAIGTANDARVSFHVEELLISEHCVGASLLGLFAHLATELHSTLTRRNDATRGDTTASAASRCSSGMSEIGLRTRIRDPHPPPMLPRSREYSASAVEHTRKPYSVRFDIWTATRKDKYAWRPFF